MYIYKLVIDDFNSIDTRIYSADVFLSNVEWNEICLRVMRQCYDTYINSETYKKRCFIMGSNSFRVCINDFFDSINDEFIALGFIPWKLEPRATSEFNAIIDLGKEYEVLKYDDSSVKMSKELANQINQKSI